MDPVTAAFTLMSIAAIGCLDGSVPANGICLNGTKPSHVEVNLINGDGDGAPGFPNKLKAENVSSLLQVKVDHKVILTVPVDQVPPGVITTAISAMNQEMEWREKQAENMAEYAKNTTGYLDQIQKLLHMK